MKRRSVDASLQLKSNAGAGGAALAVIALAAGVRTGWDSEILVVELR